MILKKKEIIAASLVVLIGLAGYMNWAYQDTVRVRDNESYIETGKMLGEAEMVSAQNEAQESEAEEAVENTAYFADAKMNRETARAAAMEALKAASQDETLDEDTRKLAGERLVAAADNIELESSVEGIAAAKGFSEVCVYINENRATVTVKSDSLSDDDIAKLTDIVTSSAGIQASAVRIIGVQ